MCVTSPNKETDLVCLVYRYTLWIMETKWLIMLIHCPLKFCYFHKYKNMILKTNFEDNYVSPSFHKFGGKNLYHKWPWQRTFVLQAFSNFGKLRWKFIKIYYFFFRLSKQNACRGRYKLNHIVEHQSVSREGLCLFERYLFTF